MKKISAVWVGYGLMGRSLALSASAKEWIRPVGVVDRSVGSLERATGDLGLEPEQLYASLPKALAREQPDLVLINTPSELHCRQALQALEFGAHVFVAKPVVSTVSQANSLLATARLAKRKVVVGQQMRFNLHYRAVGAFVASGELGRISHIHLMNSKPRPEPKNLGEMPHPAMLEMACHHFDALLGIFPRMRPVSIQAWGYRPSWSPYRGHSMVDAVVELSGGVRLLYHSGFDARAPYYELRIEGERGVLRVRGEHMSAESFDYEFAPALGTFQSIDLESRVKAASAWSIFFDLWQAWLKGGKEPNFSLRGNMPVFALTQAGIESINRRRRIDLTTDARYKNLLKS